MYNTAFLFFGGSMKIFILILCALLFWGCSDSGNDKVDFEISYLLDQGRTCKTYLADHFLVTVYDSEQRKMTEKKIPCDAEKNDGMTLSVDKDSYYVSVVLRDSKNDWQSYGAVETDVLGDTKILINMKPYIGGMIFKWNSDNCKKNNIAFMGFDLVSDGEPVKAVVWGREAEIKKHMVPCVAGRLELINIDPEPTYSMAANAYRKSDSKQSRISYEIPEFVSGHGKNKEIDIDDPKKVTKTVLVSDMKISWEFDSKSIDSCETAGISDIVAVLDSDKNQITARQTCDNKFSDLYIYDITEHEYMLYLQGKKSSGEILFESSLDVGVIEPGSVGKDILEQKVLLKEK